MSFLFLTGERDVELIGDSQKVLSELMCAFMNELRVQGEKT